MSFVSCYKRSSIILMEGALGERLKREYNMPFNDIVALADIIYRKGGKEALAELWNQYIDIAQKYNLPFIATTPTRRANKERVFRAGFSETIVLDNVSLLKQLRDTSDHEIYIGGLMGCKGDAYKATEILQVDEAQEFHSWQADLFMKAGVDFLFAGIMPSLSEAIGMAKAMEQTVLPYIISFMLGDNGKLPDGTTINDAILQIDNSVNQKPVCYMTNCIHPTILFKALSYDFNKTPLVKSRFHGIQANTSALSPEELDNSAELICSNPIELAWAVSKLRELISLKIAGGCCGTDNTHIDQIALHLRQ
ncbi:homocysteine S-methyltransferase family protein [Desulfosporosinus sp. PR]|uniref:homocysteine S-methyltransferase family protein n=1 Tax=Candidatus Desulfosporosinus nitrosoreducens TaxID=3401928 RepID=UPI0027FD0E4E|nr:homocysteine S-methyltransferase family protein [Desulfosporosinus sp. PR]MDQ7094330.1 homocysteine S-methyltransferase family protein [Desulfosporosinus sp. PR]